MRHLPSPSPLLHMTSKLGCDQVQPYTGRRHKFFSTLFPAHPQQALTSLVLLTLHPAFWVTLNKPLALSGSRIEPNT